MGQPRWDQAHHEPGEIVLSHRQREWLVTAPDDTLTALLYQDRDSGDLTVAIVDPETYQLRDEVEVPWDGRLDQPIVRLHNAEQDITDLPTTTEGSHE